MGEERGVFRFLVGKQERKRPLGRPRRRWVDNISMDLQEVGCGHVEWIGLAQDRDRWRTVVIAVMRWAVYAARMGEEREVYRVLSGNWREGDHWGDLGVDGWIILGWICRRWDVGIWTGLGWPRIETGGGQL